MSERRQTQRRTIPAILPSTTTERRRSERRQLERRSANRVPLDLWVEEERGDELYFRRTGNIGVGGLSFEQTIPHRPGTEVRLRFSLPDDVPARVIEVRAVVVAGARDDGLGMGLRFIDLAATDRDAVAGWIRSG